ncbi:MAG: 1-acyl-sn-glycerol-3-phosphate acyltransferase [Armatimonadetes bacterium]|nr:1-acyl-sn-glycerol-3-phosphate acyltransferase [Armatimonadota bacterium]
MKGIQIQYRAVGCAGWGICRILGRATLHGTENIPRSGGLIVVSNHLSHLDPPVIAGVVGCRQVYFMAKEELFRVPLVGAYLRSVGTFPVKRGAADRAALRRAFDTLAGGRALGMFPEGHRSEDGRLQPGEEGVGLIALRSRAPILPIGIAGTNTVLPAHSLLLRPGKVSICIGSPFLLDDLYDRPRRETVSEATRRIMAAIQDILPPRHHPAPNGERVSG